MKKLFYSAVALVAFSSVSIANTIAVDENTLVLTPTCESQSQMDTENYEKAYGCLTAKQWEFVYNSYLAACKKLTKVEPLMK